MNILVIDTETTGLNPQQDSLLEIAAILWSTKYKCIITQTSTLIQYFQFIENPAEPINGIPPAALQGANNYKVAVDLINEMALSAKYICAHNAEFDKAFCKKLVYLKISSKSWVDTQDITYPKSEYTKGTSLNNLAIAHGIPILGSHRALNDCDVLVKLLALVPNLDKQLEKACRPKVLVKSLEEKPGSLSKKKGFIWHSIIPFAWAKYMPEEDVSLLPFKAVKVSFSEARSLHSEESEEYDLN